ncbi:MAG: hypothetical protein U0169_14735 [Polyangiaceae bacterium]
MPETPSPELPTLILVVTAGVGVPSDLRFPPGESVESISLGRRGSWFFDAAGVRDVHAHLTFDGTRLHFRSDTAEDPATLDGAPAPTSWVVLVAPCTLGFGNVRVEVTSTEHDHDATVVQTTPTTGVRDPASRPAASIASARMMFPPSAESAPTVLEPAESGSREYPDLATSDDGEDATRIDPIAPLAPAVLPEVPRRSAPPPASGPLGPPRKPMDTVPSERHMRALLDASDANARASAVEGARAGGSRGSPTDVRRASASPSALAREWRDASLPKKAIVLLMPFALVATWFVFDGGDATTSGSSARTGPTTSLGGTTRDGSVAPRDGSVDPRGPVVVVVGPNGPSVPADLHVDAASTAVAPVSSASPMPSSRLPPSSPSATSKGPAPKSAERAAIDAVASGSYLEAARLYDELAAARPDKPAFHEAARILRGKSTPSKGP